MEIDAILQLLANIATILGFSKDLYCDDEEGIDRVMLCFLKHLSIKSKAIKEIHMKYHALQSNMQSISVALRNKDFYNKNSVNVKELEGIIQSSLQSASMLSAQCHLQTDLAPTFKSLQIRLKDSNLQSISDEEIRNYINHIISQQKNLKKLHNKYTQVLRIIHSFPMGEWSESEYDYIRQQYEVFIVDYFHIIDFADSLIMRYLDVFNSVICKYVE